MHFWWDNVQRRTDESTMTTDAQRGETLYTVEQPQDKDKKPIENAK